MDITRLDELLANWVDYMRQDSHKLGYPSKSLMIMTGGVSGADEFEIMCEAMDIDLGIKMNSIVDSLTKPQQTAVNHKWLGVMHFYPTQELDYEEAQSEMIRLCEKRSVY